MTANRKSKIKNGSVLSLHEYGVRRQVLHGIHQAIVGHLPRGSPLVQEFEFQGGFPVDGSEKSSSPYEVNGHRDLFISHVRDPESDQGETGC